MVARGTARMQESVVEESTLQLVIDQLEELVVTVIEEIRERPGVALAIVAGLIGAFCGAKLAARMSRHRAMAPRRVARKARRVGDAAELAGLGVRLMQNPIVRGLVLAAIEKQLKRQLSL
jgi:hypothetical protein